MLIFMEMARDIATALWYTGVDPFTKQEVYVAKGLRDRKLQRALMQFFKPENWFTVREALIQDQVAPLRPLDRRPEIRVVPGIDDPTAKCLPAGIPRTTTVLTLDAFATAFDEALRSGVLTTIVAKVEAIGPAKYVTALPLLENRFQFQRYLADDADTDAAR